MIEQGYTEHVSLKNSLVNDILTCGEKDETGLNDFQKLPTDIAVKIPRVGINNYKLPLMVKNKFGELRSHDCTASMYVSLNANKNGVSMSRLCTTLQNAGQEAPLTSNFVKNILDEYSVRLKDSDTEDPIEEAYLKLKFNYPVKQKSLKSDNWGWQYYPVEISGKRNAKGDFEYFVTMTYFYSSTCPCSLSMAKQYEREFAMGETSEGTGIGVPHSQRSKLTCTVKVADENFYIEDLLDLLKIAIPTETQSLVKRVDEQAFAILNGTHPMFVEHATKRVYSVLNEQKNILDWFVELEHIESLHSHNAAAVIYKGVPGGLSQDSIF